MFNLQGSELIIVLLLALVVLGPEKLPEAMRKAGQAYAELKKMSSGFQSEFRAAVDEPLREIRETANVLRDSADFTKLQSGEREEKPKSAEMAPADAVPVAAIPTFDTPNDSGGSPARSVDSEPAPFEDEPSEPRAIPPSATITSHAPFTGMSSTRPSGHEAEV
ncbi:MAG: twin-arginine translocase TatA/TatE family subunit, partial [Ilumatobacter sp.]